MYKTELIKRTARETRLSQATVNTALTASLRQIAAALAAGESVTLPGFGTFYPSAHQAGRIRDVRTGKLIAIPARRTAAFRAGEILKRAVAATSGKPQRRRRLFRIPGR